MRIIRIIEIADEVQRVPDLLSNRQGVIDAGRKPGRFILADSGQFALIESVTQSLAGRTASLNSLPFSLVCRPVWAVAESELFG